MGDLLTFGELAAIERVNPTTISDLVRRKDIPTHRVPRNGNAKGLDEWAVEVIREALKPAKAS